MKLKRRRLVVEGLVVLAFFGLATTLLLSSYHQALRAPLEETARAPALREGPAPDQEGAENRATVFGALGGLAVLATLVVGGFLARDSTRWMRLKRVRERQRVAVRQAYRYLSAKRGPPRLNN